MKEKLASGGGDMGAASGETLDAEEEDDSIGPPLSLQVENQQFINYVTRFIILFLY